MLSLVFEGSNVSSEMFLYVAAACQETLCTSKLVTVVHPAGGFI